MTPYVILRRVFRWIAVLVGIFLALEGSGIRDTAWTTLTAAFMLVAVGFIAMWSVLSHASCTIILMMTSPFNVGDQIEFLDTPNIQGEVVDLSLLFTVLRTETGDLIQIPNNQFFQRKVRRQMGDTEIALEEQINREEEHITLLTLAVIVTDSLRKGVMAPTA